MSSSSASIACTRFSVKLRSIAYSRRCRFPAASFAKSAKRSAAATSASSSCPASLAPAPAPPQAASPVAVFPRLRCPSPAWTAPGASSDLRAEHLDLPFQSGSVGGHRRAFYFVKGGECALRLSQFLFELDQSLITVDFFFPPRLLNLGGVDQLLFEQNFIVSKIRLGLLFAQARDPRVASFSFAVSIWLRCAAVTSHSPRACRNCLRFSISLRSTSRFTAYSDCKPQLLLLQRGTGRRPARLSRRQPPPAALRSLTNRARCQTRPDVFLRCGATFAVFSADSRRPPRSSSSTPFSRLRRPRKPAL